MKQSQVVDRTNFVNELANDWICSCSVLSESMHLIRGQSLNHAITCSLTLFTHFLNWWNWPVPSVCTLNVHSLSRLMERQFLLYYHWLWPTALTLVVLIAPPKKWICIRTTYVGYFDVWNLAWKSRTPNPLKNRGHRPPKFWFWMKFAIKTSPSLHRWPSWPPDDLCRVFWCMKPCLEVSDPKPPEKPGPPASKVLILDEICDWKMKMLLLTITI